MDIPALGLGLLSLLSLAAMLASPIDARGDNSDYERAVFEDTAGGRLPYRILRPSGAEPGRRYPLVLFLHGAGERGEDNERHLKFGGPLFSDPKTREQYPAIVVFPQCRKEGEKEGYWVDIDIRRKLYAREEQAFEEVFAPPMPELQRVMDLVDHLAATEPVDADRMYVMGLSMGALATYETLARWPGKFAAAVAICGGGNVEATERYAKRTPIWITHGTLDEIVPVEYSRRLHRALLERGAEVKYTEFAEAKHDAWTPTLAMPELLPWLFSHRKPSDTTAE